MSASRCRSLGKTHLLLNPRPLDDCVNEIRRDIPQNFCFAIWPADGHFVHLVACSQTEVQPQIVLRTVTSAATYFVDLHQVPRLHRAPPADCRFMFFVPSQLDPTTPFLTALPLHRNDT